MSADAYVPRPADKFSFGLWTVANRGRDPFGDVVPIILDGQSVGSIAVNDLIP